jgi:hypothetical protein
MRPDIAGDGKVQGHDDADHDQDGVDAGADVSNDGAGRLMIPDQVETCGAGGESDQQTDTPIPAMKRWIARPDLRSDAPPRAADQHGCVHV